MTRLVLKRLFYILVVILFPIVLTAQDDEKEQGQDREETKQEDPKSSKASWFNIGVSFAPEYNSLIMLSRLGLEEATKNQSYSVGIPVEMWLHPRISLRTGFSFGTKRYNHQHDSLVFGTDIDSKTGVISSSSITSSLNYGEVRIPGILRWNITKNKSPLFVTLGMEIQYQFDLKTKQTIYYGNGVIKIDKLSKDVAGNLNTALIASFGYNLNISNKMQLLLEPYYRIYASDFIILDSHMQTFGIKTTFSYRL